MNIHINVHTIVHKNEYLLVLGSSKHFWNFSYEMETIHLQGSLYPKKGQTMKQPYICECFTNSSQISEKLSWNKNGRECGKFHVKTDIHRCIQNTEPYQTRYSQNIIKFLVNDSFLMYFTNIVLPKHSNCVDFA